MHDAVKEIQSLVKVTGKRTFKNKGKEQFEQDMPYEITHRGDDVKEAIRAIIKHWVT
jgi:hypothetical protein